MENIIALLSVIISSGTLTAIIKSIIDYKKQKRELKETISNIDAEQNKNINILITEIYKQNETILELKEITKNIFFVSELESTLLNIVNKVLAYNTIDDNRKIEISKIINIYIGISKNIISTNWQTKNVLHQLKLFLPLNVGFECEKYVSELNDIIEFENGYRRKKFLELSEKFVWQIIEKINN